MLLLLQALEYPTHPSLAGPGPNKPKIIPKMETRTGASHLAGEQIRVLLSKCPDASGRAVVSLRVPSQGALIYTGQTLPAGIPCNNSRQNTNVPF